ncbi:hypothetical protein D9619_007657 [Psilocybe cf. subviscida]|uniref:Uncharacterized protein n=1 Tax=Psilocybe cf. subviscida TaxID=2480587 RepID=A0A8H5AUD0_9AGAR|nr:hypothetical protein D9619_007657 [Psilocybe cf. subviscida]
MWEKRPLISAFRPRLRRARLSRNPGGPSETQMACQAARSRRSNRVGTGIIGIGMFLRTWVPRFGFLIVILLGACEMRECGLVKEMKCQNNQFTVFEGCHVLVYGTGAVQTDYGPRGRGTTTTKTMCDEEHDEEKVKGRARRMQRIHARGPTNAQRELWRWSGSWHKFWHQRCRARMAVTTPRTLAPALALVPRWPP